MYSLIIVSNKKPQAASAAAIIKGNKKCRSSDELYNMTLCDLKKIMVTEGMHKSLNEIVLFFFLKRKTN